MSIRTGMAVLVWLSGCLIMSVSFLLFTVLFYWEGENCYVALLNTTIILYTSCSMYTFLIQDITRMKLHSNTRQEKQFRIEKALPLTVHYSRPFESRQTLTRKEKRSPAVIL